MQPELNRRTCLSTLTFAQIAQSVSASKAAILEHPARSHLWGAHQLKDIRKLPEWRRTLYNACCWGGARSKKQALEPNFPEIDELRCSCHHTHSRSEWTPYRTTDAAWHYPSTGEAEYTADLAFAIAVALSWWAVRTGRAKLHFPRAPVVQDTGNRSGWTNMPPQVMRSWVVAATAIRLGLKPPATRPGQWFPEEDTAKLTCWRKHVTAKNPAGDAVYVSDGGVQPQPPHKMGIPIRARSAQYSGRVLHEVSAVAPLPEGAERFSERERWQRASL